MGIFFVKFYYEMNSQTLETHSVDGTKWTGNVAAKKYHLKTYKLFMKRAEFDPEAKLNMTSVSLR